LLVIDAVWLFLMYGQILLIPHPWYYTGAVFSNIPYYQKV
jgi:hypothetical protein